MSPKTILMALALAATFLTTTHATADDRIALLVANNQGVGDDAALRYTSSDVQRMASSLIDLGRFEGQNVHVIVGATAEQILDNIEALTKGKEPEVFFFYYSGHADAGGLRLDGTRLPMDVLLQRLDRVPARLRLAVLDACQSGAAARPKGVTQGEAFEVRVAPDMASGQVVIASSAADEASFESDRHKGAIFTLHWTTGLRGAADADKDGRVTLTEAYDYAYGRTVGATLLARTGPQRPTYRWELAGHRDPTLTWLGSASGLTLSAEDDAHYLIFDDGEQQLMAEVAMLKGDARRIALPPGDYLVKRRTGDALHIAQLRLRKSDDRRLYDHQMREVPLVKLSRKGSLGDRWLTAALGQAFTPIGALGQVQGNFGLEWEAESWLWHAGLDLSTGTQTLQDLQTRLTWVGLGVAPLYTWRLGAAALRLGPTAGGLLIVQTPEFRPTRTALGLQAGLRLRFDLQLTPSVGITTQADALGLFAQTEDAAQAVDLGPVSLTPWASWQIGLRVSF